MTFAIGVDDADGFNKYIINILVISASVAWLLGLFIRSINMRLIRLRKPFCIAMSLQLLFVTLRNFSTLMLSSGFAIQCRWVAVIGTVLYQLFAISAECALLIRCRSFTRYPKTVTYLTITTWLIRFGLCIWLVTTTEAENNETGFACNISMNYHLSAIFQYIKICSESIILVFFLERVIALHRDSVNSQMDRGHNRWRRLALINSGITFLVILSEILVAQIAVYLTDYLLLTYSMVNLIQATLVVLMVEDTKSVFKDQQRLTIEATLSRNDSYDRITVSSNMDLRHTRGENNGNDGDGTYRIAIPPAILHRSSGPETPNSGTPLVPTVKDRRSSTQHSGCSSLGMEMKEDEDPLSVVCDFEQMLRIGPTDPMWAEAGIPMTSSPKSKL